MKSILLILILLQLLPLHAQEFSFIDGKRKAVIPFKQINNLIFLPVMVNGVELTFLLDTGVEQTILFSLDDKEISFDNVEKIDLRGLGQSESIPGLRSAGNKVRIGALQDNAHEIYIILDQEFNFSAYIGIPVNGILGYQFFKDQLVMLDYDKKRITVYAKKDKARNKFSGRFTEVPITIEKNKPYVVAEADHETPIPVKLLVDCGSSDALWLFKDKAVALPENHLDDYLGRGFSGEIYGARGRIEGFTIGGFKFREPVVAFPDSVFIRNISRVEKRAGSLGGEILKRFKVVFDYQRGKMYLKKSRRFGDPFGYNMSGMEIQHAGMQWVQETVPMQTVISNTVDANGDRIRNDFKYKFELKPTYTIATIRENSPADEGGLMKGDTLVLINGRHAYKYSLHEINDILKSEEGKQVQFQVSRGGRVIKTHLTLKKVI